MVKTMVAAAVEVAAVMAAIGGGAVPGGTTTETPAIAAVVVAMGVARARCTAAREGGTAGLRRQIEPPALGRAGWLFHLVPTLRLS